MKFQRLFFVVIIALFMTGLDGSTPKVNSARMLLAKLRGGNYAHAGDKEAVDMVIRKVLQMSPEIRNGHCLDVGSGFGGTANDIYEMGFQSIWGIDLDEAAVNYAKKLYPHIHFVHADAASTSQLFEPDFFSFIYLFNVAYAIEDKEALLQSLYKVARPGATLAIFDYSTEQRSFDFKDLAGKAMHPIVLTDLNKSLAESGWQMCETIDVTDQFISWYHTLLEKLEKEHGQLSLQFSEEDISRVRRTFETLTQWLENSLMGGVIILCKK